MWQQCNKTRDKYELKVVKLKILGKLFLLLTANLWSGIY